MFRLTVVFGPSATTWGFLFKEKETAQSAVNLLTDFSGDPIVSKVILSDDFGQTSEIKTTNIHGYMVEDLSLAADAQVENQLALARAHARFQEAVMKDDDPALKAAIRNQRAQMAMNGQFAPAPGPMPPGFRI